MGSYDEVYQLCLNQYNWKVDTTAKPGPKGVNRALKAGQSSNTIASKLTAYARKFPEPPAGYPDKTPDGVWAYKLFYSYGAGSHFIETNTNIALGFAEEDSPLPKMPPAFTAEDAWELAMQGWYYTGDTRFLDVSTAEGKAELERRLEFAKQHPLSWDGVDHNLYAFFVVCNMVPSQPAPFGVRVSELASQNYGFSIQKWLDNQWAVREMLPAPWGAGGLKQG